MHWATWPMAEELKQALYLRPQWLQLSGTLPVTCKWRSQGCGPGVYWLYKHNAWVNTLTNHHLSLLSPKPHVSQRVWFARLYSALASFRGHSQILSCFSPQLRDKIWKWPGNEANSASSSISQHIVYTLNADINAEEIHNNLFNQKLLAQHCKWSKVDGAWKHEVSSYVLLFSLNQVQKWVHNQVHSPVHGLGFALTHKRLVSVHKVQC